MSIKLKNLAKKGLSMTQAMSISNQCYQRACDIADILNSINNCSKTVLFKGEKYPSQAAYPIPDETLELLKEKSLLHAVQGFLVENIKHKEQLLNAARNRKFIPFEGQEEKPQIPEVPKFRLFVEKPPVTNEWGWEQLTLVEQAEYTEAEAYASHIGQFIHKDKPLDKLRRELPKIKILDWVTPPGANSEACPISAVIHHTPEQLLEVHDKLAEEHRKWEKTVNYFVAKVHNMVTDKNAEIARENGKELVLVNAENNELRSAYNEKLDAYNKQVEKDQYRFEEEKEKKVKEVAGFRIQVDKRFQAIIDKYKLEEKAEQKAA